MPRGWERLTPAQRRVFALVAAGRSTMQIAAELGTSPHTVQAHRVHISVRLGLRGHNALQRFALAFAARA
ncbi:MAG: helix-turn-helix transcriptional regulator [Verrucomicrobia bacterium]|nr:helix-turn-helix transcriptional regulator [Verrucomicrobiota bacterium]